MLLNYRRIEVLTEDDFEDYFHQLLTLFSNNYNRILCFKDVSRPDIYVTENNNALYIYYKDIVCFFCFHQGRFYQETGSTKYLYIKRTGMHYSWANQEDNDIQCKLHKDEKILKADIKDLIKLVYSII